VELSTPLTMLWHARFTITAAILAVSATAIIKGHHDAWAGDAFYKASLKDDILFAACAVAAFGTAWIGAYSPAYYLCLTLIFFYEGVWNVKMLLDGGYVIKGSHGCSDCISNASELISRLPDCVFAGLLATIAARLIIERPITVAANVSMAILAIVGWVQHTFILEALNQPEYVMAQLVKLVPFVSIAMLATLVTVSAFSRFGVYEDPPHLVARVTLAVVIFFIAPLLPLFI
jgi:hypothetical protein